MGWGRLGGTTPATCAWLLGAAPELRAAPATSPAGAREPGEAAKAWELGEGSESQGNSGKLGVWDSLAAADSHPELCSRSAGSSSDSRVRRASQGLAWDQPWSYPSRAAGPEPFPCQSRGMQALRPCFPICPAAAAWHTRVVGLLVVPYAAGSCLS